MSAPQSVPTDTSTDDPPAEKWHQPATTNSPENVEDDEDALYSNAPSHVPSLDKQDDVANPLPQQSVVDVTPVIPTAVTQVTQSVPAIHSSYSPQSFNPPQKQIDDITTSSHTTPAPSLAQVHQLQLAQAHQLQLAQSSHLAEQTQQLNQSLQEQSSPQQQHLQPQPQFNQRSTPRSGNDPSSVAKIFVGGLSWETDEDSLRNYFQTIGPVLDCVIMRDRHTGHPRGFGFVTFADEASAAEAATRRHDLDGRHVEAKRAVPRNEGGTAGTAATALPSTTNQGNPAIGRTSPQTSRVGLPDAGNVGATNANVGGTGGSAAGHRGHHSTRCKVFVGGLPSSCGGDEFRAYFSQYGEVVDAQVMIDHNTGNSRGFGFVTFANEETVTAVVGPGKSNTDHEIMGKCVEVKRAEPKGPPSERRNSYRHDNFNAAGSAGGNGGATGGNPGGGGLRGHAGGNNAGLGGHTGSNGSANTAAVAAAAAYYNNYPALAEQYGAYYSNPQWQQYFAAMGYNMNAYPQGFNPYQQYLQAYMNNAGAAPTGGAAGAGGGNPGNAGGAGGMASGPGGFGAVSGGMAMNGVGAGNPSADGSGGKFHSARFDFSLFSIS